MVFNRNFCAISTLRDEFVRGLYLWHLQSVAKVLKQELSCSSRPVVDSGLSRVFLQGLHWFLSFLTHARQMEQSWHCLYNKVRHFVTLLTPKWHVWPSKEHLDVWFTVSNTNNLRRRWRGGAKLWLVLFLCLNVCFVFVTVSHAAVCLVQPIFTFYNFMGVWLNIYSTVGLKLLFCGFNYNMINQMSRASGIFVCLVVCVLI